MPISLSFYLQRCGAFLRSCLKAQQPFWKTILLWGVLLSFGMQGVVKALTILPDQGWLHPTSPVYSLAKFWSVFSFWSIQAISIFVVFIHPFLLAFLMWRQRQSAVPFLTQQLTYLRHKHAPHIVLLLICLLPIFLTVVVMYGIEFLLMHFNTCQGSSWLSSSFKELLYLLLFAIVLVMLLFFPFGYLRFIWQWQKNFSRLWAIICLLSCMLVFFLFYSFYFILAAAELWWKTIICAIT